MSTPHQRIQGHEEILEAFGYWPSFHDAEVRSLLLDRNAVLFENIAEPRLDLCLHAFEWTRGAQPVFNHHLVHFRFHEVDELSFEGFNQQNAILEFRIEEDTREPAFPAGLKLTLVPAYGLSGCFCAASAEVLMIIPCDQKGRPRQKSGPAASPLGGLAEPFSNSGTGSGPPSVR